MVWLRRPSVNINNFHHSVPHHCKEQTLLRHLAVSPAAVLPPFLLSSSCQARNSCVETKRSAHRTKTLPHSSSFCLKYTFFFLLQTLCGNSALHERPLYVTESPSSCRRFPLVDAPALTVLFYFGGSEHVTRASLILAAPLRLDVDGQVLCCRCVAGETFGKGKGGRGCLCRTGRSSFTPPAAPFNFSQLY